jgi:hypothetical protein
VTVEPRHDNMVVGMTLTDITYNHLVVDDVKPGSLAEIAGVAIGSELVMIDGFVVSGMGINTNRPFLSLNKYTHYLCESSVQGLVF